MPAASRVPEAKAAEERELVVPALRVRRQFVELLDAAAPDHDVVGLHRVSQQLDHLEHELAPLLLPPLLERALADVVLERPVPKRKVGELQGVGEAVADECGAEAGAQAEEEHAAAVVASERLHDRVVHDLRRSAERALEVEVDPAFAKVGGLQNRPVAPDRHRDADAHDVPRPALGRHAHLLDHVAGRHRWAGLALAWLDLALSEQLDVGTADVDGEDTLLGHGHMMTVSNNTMCQPPASLTV